VDHWQGCSSAPPGDRTTFQVRTRVAEIRDDNSDEPTTFALAQNALLPIGMFQIGESDGKRYLESGQQLIPESLLSKPLFDVMEVIAGHGDDMEEKLTGRNVY
jgi:hypothetical protein